LRRYVKDETVDLVYLDPPFKSDQNYNVLFVERDGARSASQARAFRDTWLWDETAAAAYHEVVEHGPDAVAKAMTGFRALLSDSDMLAYLAMMAPRLVELRRVLKPTGSVYLHCDPTASHYLKLLMDAAFRPQQFQNEIIWQRTPSKSLMKRRLPSNHDTILAYRNGDETTWNLEATFQGYDPKKLDAKTAGKYSHQDPDGRVYRLDNLINPNPNRPNLTYEFLGVKKVWRWTKDRMQRAYDAGLVVQTKSGAVPQLKRYLDEQRGRPLADVWADISPLNSQARERLGCQSNELDAGGQRETGSGVYQRVVRP
jgi:site-specific DNA-methyltransferase (adenine-specific)